MAQLTVHAAVQLGLQLLAARQVNHLFVRWTPDKYIIVQLKRGRFRVTYATHGEVAEECFGSDQILALFRNMSRTDRKCPTIIVRRSNGFQVKLFTPLARAIHAGTNFLGPDFLKLDEPPTPQEIYQNYVYFESELNKNGKAPRAYHVDGMRQYMASGRHNHPITGRPMRRNNLRRAGQE
jgi:hypothetical protein